MTEEELFKCAKQELEWLRYYSHVDSREAFSVESDIYTDLKPIGYAKKNLPLDARCVPCIITSNNPINSETLIDNLFVIGSSRNKNQNKYSPLEIVWIIFPKKRNWIINKLKY
jgi:hypothetical protein